MWQVIVLAFFSLSFTVNAGQFVQPDNLYPKVRLVTSHGDIEVELDRAKAPITVNNFLTYVKKKLYNNTVFHRLEAEFVLQGGGYDSNYQPIEQLKTI